MSQKQSQKRSRSQKPTKPKSQKLTSLDELAPDITPKHVMELMQMPVAEVEKKVAEKQAFQQGLKGVLEQNMNVLQTLADQKAQFEVEISVNKRFHTKQKQIVSEGTEEFKEAQAMYNELVDEFDRIQAKATAKRNEYQQMAKEFVAMSKAKEKECEGYSQILSEKQSESEKADEMINKMELALAEKRAQNIQRRTALQEKQRARLDLQAKVSSIDLNALTARLEEVKLANDKKHLQIQVLREKEKSVQAARGELAVNKIIAEAALEEVELECALKSEKLVDCESKLDEQIRIVRNTATAKMNERIERIKQGNKNLAVQVQDKSEEIASNMALSIGMQQEFQDVCSALQKAKQEYAKKLDENMQLAKDIADIPNTVIDRQQEKDELKEKIKVAKQETDAILKEIKEMAQKYSKKMKKEQRRQAFLGVLEESSIGTTSDTEPFDLNMSSSMASDIVVNLPKVDLNETDNACAQLEQMKGK